MNLVVSHADHLRNGQAASTASNGQASKGKPRKGSALLGRGIADTPVSIATIDDEERSIVIQGEVIKIDVGRREPAGTLSPSLSRIGRIPSRLRSFPRIRSWPMPFAVGCG